jgi:hypothetical protein
MLALASEDQLQLTVRARQKRIVIVTLYVSQRDTYELKLKTDLFLESQDQAQTTMEEVSVARNFLKSELITNVMEVMEKTKTTWTKARKYSPKNVFHRVN